MVQHINAFIKLLYYYLISDIIAQGAFKDYEAEIRNTDFTSCPIDSNHPCLQSVSIFKAQNLLTSYSW